MNFLCLPLFCLPFVKLKSIECSSILKVHITKSYFVQEQKTTGTRNLLQLNFLSVSFMTMVDLGRIEGSNLMRISLISVTSTVNTFQLFAFASLTRWRVGPSL